MTRLQPWQAEALVLMSRAYAGEYSSASSDKPTDAPWADEEAQEKKDAKMQDTIVAGFRGLMARRGDG